MKSLINENKITLIGNKFSAYTLGIFLRYNLNNYNMNKKIEIFNLKKTKFSFLIQ